MLLHLIVFGLVKLLQSQNALLSLVSTSGDCNHHRRDAVCDETGEEFSNLCLLETSGRKLAHRGHCFRGCRRAGVVCAHNGATYRSECAAWAEGTAMDYYGHCVTVGYLTGMGLAIVL